MQNIKSVFEVLSSIYSAVNTELSDRQTSHIAPQTCRYTTLWNMVRYSWQVHDGV